MCSALWTFDCCCWKVRCCFCHVKRYERRPLVRQTKKMKRIYGRILSINFGLRKIEKSCCYWIFNELFHCFRFFCSVLICCLFAAPCLYIWLNWLSAVDEEIFSQYKFGCISIAISCIIEVIAETPVFVAQVFCFVKLKVVLDTFHIFVRSVLFIWLVLREPNQAIYAFSVAQVGSSITFLVGYYVFFYYYIRKQKQAIGLSKRNEEHHIAKSSRKNSEYDEVDESIPFNSIAEMMPGVLPNSVTKNDIHIKSKYEVVSSS